MINKKELTEIRELLETSSNPLFLFDNDVDGFCSFLLLRRAIDRGRGVAIKSFPDLQAQYLKKLDEFGSDLVVVLDKAEISSEFLTGMNERGIPLIWIDHHQTEKKEPLENVYQYNSYPTCEPTTYIAHNVFNRSQDEWIAMIGCIGDVYLPTFSKRFAETFPELFQNGITAFDALHTTEIGRMVRMINFGLMNTTTNVVSLMKYFFTASGPHDILEENTQTKAFHKRFKELNTLYMRHIHQAEATIQENTSVLYYSYSGDISMSSEIANRLYYEHQDKLVVVAYKRPEKANISIRGKQALTTTLKLIEGIEGATGGGHEEATGAMVPLDSFETFKKRLEQLDTRKR